MLSVGGVYRIFVLFPVLFVSLVKKSSDPEHNWSLSCDHRLQGIIEMCYDLFVMSFDDFLHFYCLLAFTCFPKSATLRYSVREVKNRN